MDRGSSPSSELHPSNTGIRHSPRPSSRASPSTGSRRSTVTPATRLAGYFSASTGSAMEPPAGAKHAALVHRRTPGRTPQCRSLDEPVLELRCSPGLGHDQGQRRVIPHLLGRLPDVTPSPHPALPPRPRRRHSVRRPARRPRSRRCRPGSSDAAPGRTHRPPHPGTRPPAAQPAGPDAPPPSPPGQPRSPPNRRPSAAG
jgi:hypothetical protein